MPENFGNLLRGKTFDCIEECFKGLCDKIQFYPKKLKRIIADMCNTGRHENMFAVNGLQMTKLWNLLKEIFLYIHAHRNELSEEFLNGLGYDLRAASAYFTSCPDAFEI
jgi:hypothetical protein